MSLFVFLLSVCLFVKVFLLSVYVQASFLPFCFILAELSTIVCNEDKVSLLLEQAHSCKGLKNLVKIGSQVTQEQREKAKGLGLKLISLADLEVSCALNISTHRSMVLSL